MREEPLVRKTQITIIGGGIAGCTLAYALAKRGISDAVILERKELASESSGANFASVMATMLPLRPALLPLYARTLDALPHLSEELGRDIEYRTPRINAITEEARETGQQYVDDFQRLGYGDDFRMIGQREMNDMEPNMVLPPYGLLDERGGQVNPLYLTTGFGDRARELGVRAYENTEVVDIKITKNRVKSVVTSQGDIETEYVVNACGAWGAEIGAMVGLKVPIETLKCQVIVTEVLPERYIHSGSITPIAYFMTDMDQSDKQMHCFDLYKQMERGELLLGLTEEAGSDKWVTFEAMEALARHSMKIIPKIKEQKVHITSSYCNLYAVTPDRHAMLGPVEGLENFIMDCGYADYGIGTGYGAAELLTEMILKGDKEFPIEELRYSPRYGRYEG
jgi:sarcosine oxidase subunit beta